MMKFASILCLLAGTINIMVFDAAVADENKNKRLAMQMLHFPKQNITVRVEVADDPEEQATGLMNRAELQDLEGMWFVFRQESIAKVWMKNMRIPLDILFVSAQGVIVSLLKNVPPCRQADCPIYSSSAPAKFMLEVNAGFIDRADIDVGDELVRLSD